ncbi:hypothetical protein AB0C34_17365 [Nocardia sp. NPDC049220]|uniref:hypothetical protein n=1 Tax=Nocardia sp. NPDC049220 TaxID=3155273 RepID=UPI0033CAA75F
MPRGAVLARRSTGGRPICAGPPTELGADQALAVLTAVQDGIIGMFRSGTRMVQGPGHAGGGAVFLRGRPLGVGGGQCGSSVARKPSGSLVTAVRHATTNAVISRFRDSSFFCASAFNVASGRTFKGGLVCWLAMLNILH